MRTHLCRRIYTHAHAHTHTHMRAHTHTRAHTHSTRTHTHTHSTHKHVCTHRPGEPGAWYATLPLHTVFDFDPVPSNEEADRAIER